MIIDPTAAVATCFQLKPLVLPMASPTAWLAMDPTAPPMAAAPSAMAVVTPAAIVPAPRVPPSTAMPEAIVPANVVDMAPIISSAAAPQV